MSIVNIRLGSKYRILSNSAALSNSIASLIILPDFFAFKIFSASLILLHCGPDIRGSEIGRKEF